MVVLIVVQITIARKHATKCGAATAVVLLPYPFGLHADTREARWPTHLVCNCLMRKLFAPPPPQQIAFHSLARVRFPCYAKTYELLNIPFLLAVFRMALLPGRVLWSLYARLQRLVRVGDWVRWERYFFVGLGL